MWNVTDNSTVQCLNLFSHSSTFMLHDANIPGIVLIFVFYALVFVVGIFASWCVMKRKKKAKGTALVVKTNKLEDLVLAGRDMGPFVGVFTIAATNVGGGLINGTAEVLINPHLGLVWCQAPIFYTLSMIINSLTFTKPMRERKYRTMLDPIQQHFGRIQTLFVYLPLLLADILWSASILTALGSSLSVIIGMNYLWSVVISAGVVVIYTFVGGLYSVAYTDVIELIFLLCGLWLAVPFAMTHPASSSILETARNNVTWLGPSIEGPWGGYYLDIALMLSLAGLCWQPFYQRVFALRSTKQAMVVGTLGSLMSYVCVLPAFLIGAVAFSTDWNATEYRSIGAVPVPECNYPLALPLVMRFLTPLPVAVIGLGAVSAAVMSSTDSAVLSSACLATLNLYSPIRSVVTQGKQATNRELIWVMRVVILFVGIAATTIALTVPKTYGLLVLCGDLVYVIVLPQLTSAVFIKNTNTYGSIVAFSVGFILRMLSGEPLLGLPTTIYWPYAEGEMQLFPFRTILCILSFLLLLGISWIAEYSASSFDVCQRIDAATFQCFVEKRHKVTGKQITDQHGRLMSKEYIDKESEIVEEELLQLNVVQK